MSNFIFNLSFCRLSTALLNYRLRFPSFQCFTFNVSHSLQIIYTLFIIARSCFPFLWFSSLWTFYISCTTSFGCLVLHASHLLILYISYITPFDVLHYMHCIFRMFCSSCIILLMFCIKCIASFSALHLTYFIQWTLYVSCNTSVFDVLHFMCRIFLTLCTLCVTSFKYFILFVHIVWSFLILCIVSVVRFTLLVLLLLNVLHFVFHIFQIFWISCIPFLGFSTQCIMQLRNAARIAMRITLCITSSGGFTTCVPHQSHALLYYVSHFRWFFEQSIIFRIIINSLNYQ